MEKVKSRKMEDEELLVNIKYKDKDMVDIDKDSDDIKKMVAGEVELDSDEISILKQLPKFAIYEKLAATEMKSDAEQAACKIRYNRCQLDKEVDLDEDEIKQKREEDLENRKVYDMRNKTVNFGNVRATDSRNNRHIHVAKPRNVGEEAEIEGGGLGFL